MVVVFQNIGIVCIKKRVETTKLFLSVPDLKKQIKRSLFAIYSLCTLQNYLYDFIKTLFYYKDKMYYANSSLTSFDMT